MKINWEVRLKNKTFVVSMMATIVAFAYQMAGIIGWVPPVSEDLATQLIAAVINVLVAIGVIVDPTTKELSDSEQALAYKKPQ